MYTPISTVALSTIAKMWKQSHQWREERTQLTYVSNIPLLSLNLDGN